MYAKPSGGRSVPMREVQGSDQVSDVSQQSEDSDLLVNNLSYHQPAALSLAVNRAYSRMYFQRANYAPGETAVIDFNSGTEFVDPGNSYLTFAVALIGSANTVTAHFGGGSAMNLIRQVTIKSRSGTELDRVENANLWSNTVARYTETDAYLTRQGEMEGFLSAAEEVKTVATASLSSPLVSGVGVAGTAVRFAIPLKRLAPFFNPIKKGQKIPPALMSGLHMEIIWERGEIALCQGAGAGTITATNGYAISQLAIMVDSVGMTDDVQKTINDQSARDGLEYAYPRIFTSIDSIGTNAQLNSQVRKAVSQANIAFALPMNDAAPVYTRDCLSPLQWGASLFQYRLGALYYPIQAINDSITSVPDGIEGYAQALETFDKFKHSHDESSVSKDNFVGVALGSPGEMLNRGVLAVSLEKDTALNFSGLPVNNSRVLECNTTFAALPAPPAGRNVYTFLEYASVARAYLDNTAVNI